MIFNHRQWTSFNDDRPFQNNNKQNNILIEQGLYALHDESNFESSYLVWKMLLVSERAVIRHNKKTFWYKSAVAQKAMTKKTGAAMARITGAAMTITARQ
jgi:hypothetical protein